MPWVPIQSSSIPFTFDGEGVGVSLADSVVTGVNLQGSAWGFTLTGRNHGQMRATVISYSADDSGFGQSQVAYFWWITPSGSTNQPNEAADPNTAFEPTSVEVSEADLGQDFFFGYNGAWGSEWSITENYQVFVEIWDDAPAGTSYNCECDDENNNETLGELKNKMMHLLGWGATAANPPPGVAQMLTYWLQDAQAMLYRRFTQLRTERFFSWPLVQGVRMYDLPDNQEVCTKKLDPRKLTWVGIERDGVWVPLISSIPPELYSYNTTGYPVRYEIRQCIEVWPTPDATLGNLIIKGHFGLEPFSEDDHKTTIDSLPVFQVALANAKAHYRQPDANNYIQQMEALIRDLTAGLHGTRRYIPGRRVTEERVYIEPRPTVPFANS